MCHFSSKYNGALVDKKSNEYEQFHKFIRRINRHFLKDSKSPETVDESLSKYIKIYQKNREKVESLFEL